MIKAPICFELQRGFEILNSLFQNKILPIDFSFQPKKKIGIKYFHDQKTIIIGSEILGCDESQILSDLLHEMVHVYNHQNGIEDVTTNQYHTTKYFLKVALSVGLEVIKHRSQGWSITEPNYPKNTLDRDLIRTPDRKISNLKESTFNLVNLDKTIIKKTYLEIRTVLKNQKPIKTFFLKYICNCPAPHNSIRSGRRPDGNNALNIICAFCNSKFQCITELD